MGSFLAALSFLSVLPVSRQFTVKNIRQSLVYFPVVGVLLGGAAYGIYISGSGSIDRPVVSFLLLLFYVGATGALHLDGVADVCDAFGTAGRKKTRILSIMKDSNIGAFGAVGLILLLLGKFLLIENLLGESAPTVAIFLAPVLGRGLIVPIIILLPYVRSGGLGTPYQGAGMSIGFLSALAFALPFIFYGDILLGLSIIPAIIWILLASLFFRRKLGGMTGDIYGFLIETTELVFLLGASLALKIML